MLSIASTNEERVPVTATPTTASGLPASVDGPIRVTVVSGASTFEPTGDLTFVAVSSAEPGTTVFQVEADADLGEGVSLITETVIYEVSSAIAANIGLSAGAAVPKPVINPLTPR